MDILSNSSVDKILFRESAHKFLVGCGKLFDIAEPLGEYPEYLRREKDNWKFFSAVSCKSWEYKLFIDVLPTV